jgi:hypothetical protein
VRSYDSPLMGKQIIAGPCMFQYFIEVDQQRSGPEQATQL